MTKTHHKSSKRQKLSTKYNIAKKIREHKRRVKKEARKLGVKKDRKKDPGIPNAWPFKAHMLEQIERDKAEREADLAKRRAQAKRKAKVDHKAQEVQRRQVEQDRQQKRQARRTAEGEETRKEALKRILTKADVLLQLLDARDPVGCRSANLEAFAHESGRRLISVLTKADLVAPDVVVRWLLLLGQSGPVVATQAEAGREGIRELLQLLGHMPLPAAAPNSATPSSIPAAQMVGVIGYPNTGKKALCKAIRHEVKAIVPWLIDSAGKLRPDVEETGCGAAVHLAVRGILPKGAPGDKIAAPQAVVAHLLERCSPQNVMSRYRLPAFNGIDAFLHTFAEGHNMKTKKGKTPSLETIARKMISELSASPGCFCSPNEGSSTSASNLWSAWGASRGPLESVMRAHVEALKLRGTASTTGALAIASSGLGPAVNIKDLLVEEQDALDEIAAAGGDEDMDDDEEFDDEDLEGEEEEEMEGDESEDGEMHD